MKRTIIAGLAVVLAGCTTYADGVSSYWPQPDVLVVSGAGNAFTESQDVANFVFLQAAEKALQSGYRYFVLLGQQDTSTRTTSTVYTPTTTTYSGYSYGNYVTGRATTTGGAQTYSYYFPGMEAAFRMFRDTPPGFQPGQYWTAAVVYDELGPKYLPKPFIPAHQRFSGVY